MREWILGLVPIALVGYFVMYPTKLHGVLDWIIGLAR
jgi:hypothetical protein